jgi:phenylacetate-CoA ligase
LAFNQIYLSAYHLTEENLPAYISQLKRYRPEVLVGYVSSVHLLADHINRHGLEGLVHPRAVLVSSETLFPWMRADIERAFGCKVHDGYGLGELAALITECSHGGLHISPEYGVIEAVEIDGEKRLIATGLFNQAMPLLRYDTGDVIELAPPGQRCECGRKLPLVNKLLGRADDYVVTPDGRAVGPAPLSLAFQSVSGIRESQIRQEDLNSVVVSLVIGPEYGSEQQQQLDRELRDRLGNELIINYDCVESIPRTSWGKRRLVDSRVGRRHSRSL